MTMKNQKLKKKRAKNSILSKSYKNCKKGQQTPETQKMCTFKNLQRAFKMLKGSQTFLRDLSRQKLADTKV